MPKRKLKVAVCQIPVDRRIERNGAYIRRYIARAADAGAAVIQFPETGLSGYAGTHFKSWAGYDWATLERETEQILDLARKHRIWIILGSSHRLTGRHRPHNSLYAINFRGEIVDRYDKLFCTGGDLDFYSPGNHFAVFEIEGVVCGLLICHDVRYPELYRVYQRKGVQCMLHSFHNAKAAGPSIHTVIMKPTLQAHAACNHMWVSVSNACAHYQSWSSCFIYPDGRIAGSLHRHRAGMMLHDIDGVAAYRDKCEFRDRAMRGLLHSGTVVKDPRSRRRRVV